MLGHLVYNPPGSPDSGARLAPRSTPDRNGRPGWFGRLMAQLFPRR